MTVQFVRTEQILSDHPDLVAMMKSYELAGFAECGVHIYSWPTQGAFPQVVGLFFVDRREALKPRSRRRVKQDFVVYWGSAPAPKPWYCGGLPPHATETKTRKSIHRFCLTFAINDPRPQKHYGCYLDGNEWKSKNHHYADEHDDALPIEAQIREAIGVTLRRCLASPVNSV